MNPSDLKGKRITVVGGARSGLAAARLLADRGAEVFLTEAGEGDEDLRRALDAAGVAYELGGHTDRALDADLAVVSPGVPSGAEIIQRLALGGAPVFSEVEVAAWFCESPVVAVTGSNGKTTTTSLIAHVFRTAGRPLVVAGNIGSAFADHVGDCSSETVAVLEVSSFQLDHVATFRPRVSVLLNITPDHLDRYHGDFLAYAQSKFRIAAQQGAGDAFVYSHDDALVREYAERVGPRRGVALLPFSTEAELDRGAFVRGDQIILRLSPLGSPDSPQEEVLMRTHDLSLRGQHNLYNSLAAAIAARAMEISSDVVRESLASFEGVPHRLEFVREVGGVTYVNDSKATNVNAVWYALESFDEPIVLIAGGRDKGNDYDPLVPLVKDGVRGVIGLGESGDKVVCDLGDHAKAAARADTMEEALQYAQLMAEPGDVVLLSPACASFDMYRNYEDRGDTFKRLVRSL